MSAAADRLPLPPIYTDADWAQDFAFYGATVADPLDFTGSTFSLVLAPAGFRQPAADAVYELTTEISLTDGYLVGVLAPTEGQVEDWTPGTYNVELRRLYDTDAVEVLYVGQVAVIRGLSAAAELGGLVPGFGSPGGAGAVSVFETVRIVRGEAAGAARAAIAALETLRNGDLKTADFTAAALHRYLLSTTDGGFDAGMPVGPADGDSFEAEDVGGACDTAPVIFDAGAETITCNGVVTAGPWPFNVANGAARFTYSGSTWLVRRI